MDWFLLAQRIALGLGGVAIVLTTLVSAVRTVVVPRATQVRLTGWIFKAVRSAFLLSLGRHPSYDAADRRMSLYAPVALITLPLAWLTLVVIGFAALFVALDPTTPGYAVKLSGSSITTLGFVDADRMTEAIAAFIEAAIGLFLIALLITYLPAIYSAFSRRELLVASLETAAGAPPSSVTMLERFHHLHGLAELDAVWPEWARWFADIEESHTSFSALAFFRSPQADRSWVAAAGTVLDAAALRTSAIDLPRSPYPELCIRAGTVALRRIADLFDIAHDADPDPTDETSIERREFDAVFERLKRAGLPMKPDADQAWRDFNGWRVNYDAVLLGLAALTVAPSHAHWSGDRADTLDSDTDLDRDDPDDS